MGEKQEKQRDSSEQEQEEHIKVSIVLHCSIAQSAPVSLLLLPPHSAGLGGVAKQQCQSLQLSSSTSQNSPFLCTTRALKEGDESRADQYNLQCHNDVAVYCSTLLQSAFAFASSLAPFARGHSLHSCDRRRAAKSRKEKQR